MKQSIAEMSLHLRLPFIRQQHHDIVSQATAEQWSYERFLYEVLQGESQGRANRRLTRTLQEAKLPAGKDITSFDPSRLPKQTQTQLSELAQNDGWISATENILLFGPSGVGKSHTASAIGYQMDLQGIRVLYTGATALVQELQTQRDHLHLADYLRYLDRFSLLIIDDIGYVKRSNHETGVLFELINHRYERKSMLITSNQPFDKWDSIFPDSEMTVASIDRLVHHAHVIQIEAESYRKEAYLKTYAAKKAKKAP